MTPKEALDRLRAAPDDAQAWAEVRALVVRLAERATYSPQRREEAARRVLEKLEDQLLSGDLDAIEHPVGYLARALRWRTIDLVRREKRAAAAAERAARQEQARLEAEAGQPPAPTAEALAILDRAFQKARSNRDPWQRPHIERAWRQILAIHVEGAVLRELISVELGPAADDDDVRRGVQAAHKAHERARNDVLEALTQLAERGAVDAESAADARHVMRSLRRRQLRARPGVSESKESVHA
jgi:hypothetical protein